MATLAEVEGHRQAVADLVTLAHRDLVAFWRSVETASATAARDAVREVLPELIELYGTSAAGLGADWYDDLRDDAEAPGSYTARLAETPPADQVDALARWGVGPLFSATPDAAASLALLAGGLQRLVVGMDRGTIEASAHADPAGPIYSRHASANACAFCRMLATRGAVYGSEAAATRVVGRSDGRLRGSQSLGRKFHDHCRCTSVPSWPGQEVPRAPYVADWDTAYTEATTAAGGDTSAVLAHMRQSLGAS